MGNASWHKIIIQEAQTVLRTGIQKVTSFYTDRRERFYYVLKRIFLFSTFLTFLAFEIISNIFSSMPSTFVIV